MVVVVVVVSVSELARRLKAFYANKAEAAKAPEVIRDGQNTPEDRLEGAVPLPGLFHSRHVCWLASVPTDRNACIPNLASAAVRLGYNRTWNIGGMNGSL